MYNAGKKRFLIVAANPDFVRLFLRDSIHMLRAEGHEVLVVCAPETGSQLLEEELGCDVSSIPFARSIEVSSDVRCLAKLFRLVRSWRPDIVHAHTPKAGLLGSLAARLARVPVCVHTIHGLRSETLSGPRRSIVEAMERLTAGLSTHCLAVSPSLRQRVIDAAICPAGKVRVLGAGSCAGIALEQFDPSACRAQAQAIRTGLGITGREVLITYVGRLAEDKGLAVLEAAWRLLRDRHPEAKLIIAGPQDRTDPCSPAMLERLRADPRVTLLEGFLTNPAPWMAASDIFVQPSFREGLGVAAIEAFAMEVPVVASRVTGLVDVVSQGRTGLLVDPYNATALARALSDLIRDPAIRYAMGAAGRQFVEGNFDRRLVLARLNDFYASALAEPRLRGTPARLAPTNSAPAERVPAKRILDLAVAALVLVLTVPVTLACTLAILLAMGRPVLFRQPRAGLDGAVFSVLKFRTMREPHSGEAAIGTEPNRTPWLGLWMRRLSVDELPQLWNVLRGEMSLVGPRPLLADYLPRYSPDQRRRHEVKPGITGWAQVHGRNNLGWEERFAMDVWYVDHCSFSLDLLILAKTIARLVRPRGIVPSGQGAMTEFLGSNAHFQR